MSLHLYTLAGLYVASFASLTEAMRAGAGFSYVIKGGQQ